MTNLRFREDGSFRVLQMADIQDGPNVLPDTIRLIREAIRKADPDLVVFTGDQIRGYDPAYIDTFLRRRGEEPGARVRAVTELEAKLRGIKRRARNRVNNRLLAMKSDGSNPDVQQTASTASTTSTLVYSTTSDPQDVPTTLDELMDETRDKVRRTFAGFLGPVIEAEVPFAATYGNHDFQCGILADEQDGIYREFPGCLNPVDSLEPGTFALPIEASDGSGRVAMSVMMVNSGDYAGKPEENDAQYPAYVVNPRGLDLADSDGYGTPSPEAIDWLGAVQSELGERNGDGKPVPAIAFQHIPPQEFYDCLKEVPAWTPNAVEGARTHAGHCYVLNHEICRPGSQLGEAIGCADENVGEVDALREAGGYFALFCGHDHRNAIVATKLRWPTRPPSSRNGKAKANTTSAQDEKTITRRRPIRSAYTQDSTMNSANTHTAAMSISRYCWLLKPRSPPPSAELLVPHASDQVASEIGRASCRERVSSPV